MTDITSAVEVITPEVAQILLGKNTTNRTISKATVAAYARDMKAGHWKVTGESIKVDRNGTLLDGQHRLHAVLQAQISVSMLVVRGLDPDSQSVMDTGRKRSASDMLNLAGYSNSSTVAAAARMAIAIPRNGYGAARSSSANRATNSEIAEFVEAEPLILEAATLARSVERGIDAPPAVLAYVGYRLMQIDMDEAVRFLVDVSEKANLPKDDPALTLSNRLAEARRKRESLTNEMMLSLIFRAWNARRTRKKLAILRVNSNGKGGGLIEVPEPR